MDAMHNKMAGVIQQLMARQARLTILCNEGDDDTVDMVKGKPHYHLIKVRPGALELALNDDRSFCNTASPFLWLPLI